MNQTQNHSVNEEGTQAMKLSTLQYTTKFILTKKSLQEEEKQKLIKLNYSSNETLTKKQYNSNSLYFRG